MPYVSQSGICSRSVCQSLCLSLSLSLSLFPSLAFFLFLSLILSPLLLYLFPSLCRTAVLLPHIGTSQSFRARRCADMFEAFNIYATAGALALRRHLSMRAECLVAQTSLARPRNSAMATASGQKRQHDGVERPGRRRGRARGAGTDGARANGPCGDARPQRTSAAAKRRSSAGPRAKTRGHVGERRRAPRQRQR